MICMFKEARYLLGRESATKCKDQLIVGNFPFYFAVRHDDSLITNWLPRFGITTRCVDVRR